MAKDQLTTDERLRALEEALARANEQLAQSAAEREQERRAAEADRARLINMEGQLKSAIQPGNTRVGGPGASGKMIEVKRGDFIAYDTRKGTPSVRGGWVKCSADQKTNREVCRVSVANRDFVYDEAIGAPYHSVNQTTFALFQNGEHRQVRHNFDKHTGELVEAGKPTSGLPATTNISPATDIYTPVPG